jgi:hypothetical protein
MPVTFMGRCGDDCTDCCHRASDGCPGCSGHDGNPFWGQCEIATCCVAKGHAHCGQCQDFPCARLNAYASEPDNGKILVNLKAWNEIGYDAWRQKQKEQ